jgi:hypothetical protein
MIEVLGICCVVHHWPATGGVPRPSKRLVLGVTREQQRWRNTATVGPRQTLNQSIPDSFNLWREQKRGLNLSVLHHTTPILNCTVLNLTMQHSPRLHDATQSSLHWAGEDCVASYNGGLYN